MECLWYCFSDLLQHDFDEVKDHWNSHYVRRSRFDTVAGRPDELYHLPVNHGGSEFLQNVSIEQINDMQEFCEDPESNMYQEYFEYARSQTDFIKPSNWDEAGQALGTRLTKLMGFFHKQVSILTTKPFLFTCMLPL